MKPTPPLRRKRTLCPHHHGRHVRYPSYRIQEFHAHPSPPERLGFHEPERHPCIRCVLPHPSETIGKREIGSDHFKQWKGQETCHQGWTKHEGEAINHTYQTNTYTSATKQITHCVSRTGCGRWNQNHLPHLSHSNRNYTIRTPVTGSYPFHSQSNQHAPHVTHIAPTQCSREFLLQPTEYFGGRQLYTLFVT